jgi:hypothetical protein
VTLLRVLEEAEARQLPALIAEWSERSDALRWVARALQLDLPLLIERPELVLTCLYRRCRWLGDTVFYPKRGPVPAEAEDLAGLIEEWSDARPRRWLRAVRPPPFPLDAGIIEEYRTSLVGEIRFSADGTLIGVVGETGWERATGRKVDVRDRLEAPTSKWSHERAQGRISLVAKDGPRLDLAVEDERVLRAMELGDDLVLVQASFDADPYEDVTTHVLYLVDAAAGQIRWRVEGDCRAAIRNGDILCTFGDAYIERSLATGADLAHRPFPYSHTMVFGPTGRIVATRDDSVIRVWDLDQLGAHAVRCRASGGTISADGTRLLSDALYDARTGALIAAIPFSGRGNWLEGGPPGGAWALVDHSVVEVLWRTRVWDSRDGRLVIEYDQFSVNARDVIRHDPLGRYLAIFKHPNRLTAHTIHTGATLFETTVELVDRGYRDRAFGFSDSGEDLWWETADGCYAAATASWQTRRVEAPLEPPSRELEIRDGLLVVGDLAAPMDSKEATRSRDGRVVVGADHYVLED